MCKDPRSSAVHCFQRDTRAAATEVAKQRERFVRFERGKRKCIARRSGPVTATRVRHARSQCSPRERRVGTAQLEAQRQIREQQRCVVHGKRGPRQSDARRVMPAMMTSLRAHDRAFVGEHRPPNHCVSAARHWQRREITQRRAAAPADGRPRARAERDPGAIVDACAAPSTTVIATAARLKDAHREHRATLRQRRTLHEREQRERNARVALSLAAARARAKSRRSVRELHPTARPRRCASDGGWAASSRSSFKRQRSSNCQSRGVGIVGDGIARAASASPSAGSVKQIEARIAERSRLLDAAPSANACASASSSTPRASGRAQAFAEARAPRDVARSASPSASPSPRAQARRAVVRRARTSASSAIAKRVCKSLKRLPIAALSVERFV